MQLNSKEIDEKAYIKYTLDELKRTASNYLISDCLFLLVLAVIPILPIVSNIAIWIFYGSFLITCLIQIGLIESISDYSKSELLNEWDYLVLSYIDDNNQKKHRFLIDEEYLEKIYNKFGSPDKTQQSVDKLKVQHLVDQKIIQGFQNENYARNALWYLLKDHTFYFDDDLNAILAFTTKAEAQDYVNKHLPSFDGSIIHLPLAIDGKMKDGENK